MKSSCNPHTLPLYVYTVKNHSTQSDSYMPTASWRRDVFIKFESIQGCGGEFIRATFGTRKVLSLLMAKLCIMPELMQASVKATP
jgi:hypothetical protein